MAPTLDETLAAFQRQVRTLADQVRQIENSAFRKALYVSMLDGLSACAYPNETRSGHRFRTFVLNIGNWKNGERVSLQQAALYFQADPVVSAAIAGPLNAWTWGQPQSITSDSLLNQLPGHADLWRLQHVNLLWQFRNSMLHSFADPGNLAFTLLVSALVLFIGASLVIFIMRWKDMNARGGWRESSCSRILSVQGCTRQLVLQVLAARLSSVR